MLESYHDLFDGRVNISASQASRFAREVAGDYNPIHDPDARRFCVPGDLLFALVLKRYGLSQQMRFRFSAMLGADVPLVFPESPAANFDIQDDQGRVYLEVQREGPVIEDAGVIERFTRRYVGFSGKNFPDVLTPLMARQGVMFNPDRPMVIYDSMAFELHVPQAVDQATLSLADSRLQATGKRAEARLQFHLNRGAELVGQGTKKLVLAGLQPWDESRMAAFTRDFARRRETTAG